MPNTPAPTTLDTVDLEVRRERFENAWRLWQPGHETPRWQEFLPEPGEPCSPEVISLLLHIDIEFRVKAGLQALLAEPYFQHPRLQQDDARLDAAQQVELIRWEYQQRWKHGERARRLDFESAFPQHAAALREMKPRSRCPQCDKILVLDETFQTLRCPDCGCESALLVTAPPFIGEATPAAEAAAALDVRTYQLMETLGKGGMGEVYRCGDPSLGRDLAIKVMKADYHGHPDVERRFLREARITGSLQHPSIVPVHNLGRLNDGRLHYTMRLVRGQTFAGILKDEAGKPERLPYLLSIFEKICQAVAYAHSKRVIHRDLKPHNVMVGKFGEVQVMDWGLAKVLASGERGCVSAPSEEEQGTRIHTEEGETPLELTRMGGVMGTWEYMPSEQARGKWDAVDERADVFALGSILCELLTGKPAYLGKDSDDVRDRAERGDVAEALARLEQCGADAALTALCRACLSPQPEDRPRDADAVAERVAEYQAEVQARLRQAEVERAETQLKAREERKQRRLLIALVVALLVGAALSIWQAVRATTAETKARENERQAIAERDAKDIALGKAESAAEAERQAKDAEASQRHKAEESEADTKAVLTFFQDKVLSAGRPKDQEGGLGKDVTLRQAVDKAQTDIADSFKDRPLVEASVRDTLGMTYWLLGEAKLAIEQHERALALSEAQFGADHPDTLTFRNHLANAYWSDGRTADAIRLHEQNLKQREAQGGADHPETLTSRHNLANAYRAAGRTADAIRLHEQNLKQDEAKLGVDHPSTLKSCNSLAVAYRAAGRTADAIRLHEQNLPLCEAKLGVDHPDTLKSRNSLAVAYGSAGRTSDAIRLHEQNLPLREAKLGADHPDTLRSRNSLAVAYQYAGRTADAIRLHEPNLKQYEAKLGPDHLDTLISRNSLANAYLSAGRTAEAIRLHEQNLKQYEAKRGANHPGTLISRNGLASAYASAGRTADAIRLHEQNLKLCEAKLGVDHPDTLISLTNLGVTYRDAGRLKDAIPLFEEALKRGRKRSGGLPAQVARLPGALAETYDRDGQFAKAEAIYRDLLEQARRQFGAEDPRTAEMMAGLGLNLTHQHKFSEAEPLLRAGLKVREAKQPDDWTTFDTRSQLGEALVGQKKYTEAEPLLLQGYEGMKAREAKIPPQGKVRLTEALQRLVRLYEATGKKDEAVKWRKQWEERKAPRKNPKP